MSEPPHHLRPPAAVRAVVRAHARATAPRPWWLLRAPRRPRHLTVLRHTPTSAPHAVRASALSWLWRALRGARGRVCRIEVVRQRHGPGPAAQVYAQVDHDAVQPSGKAGAAGVEVGGTMPYPNHRFLGDILGGVPIGCDPGRQAQ